MTPTYGELVDKAVATAKLAADSSISIPERALALAKVAQVYADLARTVSDRGQRQIGQ